MSQSWSSMNRQEREATVFFLLALAPALPLILIVKLGLLEPGAIGALPFSRWGLLAVAIPAIGGLIAGRGHRPRSAFLAALAGFGAFWASCSWSSGSRATSYYEVVFAAIFGVIPSALLFALFNRIDARRTGQPQPTKPRPPRPYFGPWIRLLIAGIFSAGSVIIIHDLNKLENRQAQWVRLPAPVASFYDRFGYWPAALLFPALGILALLIYSGVPGPGTRPPGR